MGCFRIFNELTLKKIEAKIEKLHIFSSFKRICFQFKNMILKLKNLPFFLTSTLFLTYIHLLDSLEIISD